MSRRCQQSEMCSGRCATAPATPAGRYATQRAMRFFWFAKVFAAVLLLLVTAGCRERDIRTEYGGRTGYNTRSVNGTSVLSKILTDSGARVRSWRLLSPSLHKADVVVWFPTDSKPPPAEVINWFDDWMRYSYENEYSDVAQEKVLIYVGRHYDAEAFYWASSRASAPAGLKGQFATRLAAAKAKAAAGPATPKPGEAPEWFTLQAASPTKQVTLYSGALAGQSDATKSGVEHNAVVHPAEQLQPLLLDDLGHPLVSEAVYELGNEDWNKGESRLIVVENGSFLLNASLVNHENRKLAGQLIAHAGLEDKEIVFLESDSAPTISDKDPELRTPTGLQFFSVWPIGAVLGQAAALGLVYAMTRFPIFGVPRRLRKPSLTDFGKHVGALARLLAATRDRAYARELLGKYFAEVKKE